MVVGMEYRRKDKMAICRLKIHDSKNNIIYFHEYVAI